MVQQFQRAFEVLVAVPVSLLLRREFRLNYILTPKLRNDFYLVLEALV